MKAIGVFWMFWIVIGRVGYGQVSDPVSITPDQVVQTLRSPNEHAIVALEERLKLGPPWTEGEACGFTYDEVSELRLGSWSGAEVVVVSAYGSPCRFQFLIPFLRTSSGWRELNPVSVGAWYERADVHAEAVVGDGQMDLVVHGNLVDRGTGLLQKNLTILRIVDEKLRVIFDRPESMHVGEPSSAHGKFYFYTDDVTSKFTFKKSVPHGDNFIEELRRSTRNGRTITELRSYNWRPELQVFQEIEEAQ